MLYVMMFDFGLAAVVIAGLGFFVWCWIVFRKERKQPIYRGCPVPAVHKAGTIPLTRRCA